MNHTRKPALTRTKLLRISKLIFQQQFLKENKKFAKKMKTDLKYKFRYKSNQIQFDFNESICDR